MSNKMSIDELVRQEIARGEEPHNLGAWANMERMLDGKNPYQEEEEKKRRPWLFMFLGFLICSTAVIGGYNYYSQSSTNINGNVATSPSNNSIPNTVVTNNSKDNKLNSQTANLAQSQTTETVAAETALASCSNRTTFDAIQKQDRIQQRALLANSTSKRSNKNPITNDNALIKQTSNITTRNNKSNQTLVSTAGPTKKKTVIDKNKLASNTKEIPPTIKEPYQDTTQVTEVSQRIKKDAAGNKIMVTDSFKYNVVKTKERTVINPRYIELTQEQEEAAQRRTAIASIATNTAPITPQTIEPSIMDNAVTKQTTLAETSTNTTKKERSSFFSLFKRAGASIRQKGIQMAHTKTPIYTGMFLGVNAALVNSKHNFGGFQGGLYAMTPLGRLITLQTEARLINQQNSGYTVTDHKKLIKSYFIDSTTLTHSKIYNYEVDSVNYGYNLKDFYTLQLPVILNAHFNKFNIYAGVHFNYGFRMNINTSSNSNAVSLADTSSSAAYKLRTDSDPQFVRDDFASRMGLGYTLGGGYNFNDRINLDLRMTNLFWDNTNAAKKEISNVFFKIPSFQFSLGYRFRKFKIEE